ncbi:MAG: 3-deoxy-8-phosphooctulonate synthase [Ignavibacteria bacterium]|nr:3-deoxy-8-phosphooctulonate synthase [Ignavibacteria bacterium]
MNFLGRNYKLGKDGVLFLIAGPCVVESEKMIFKTAEVLLETCSELNLPLIFKSSYRKANRTSRNSFRTIGIEKALKILRSVRDKFSLNVLTDVHTESEVKIASEYVDILQIPAFLSRQTELLEAAGETGKTINIKKGQFMSPYDMKYAVEKVSKMGNNKIMITERGTTFGYNNLVVDMRSIPIMKEFGYPVVFDATHSIQLPSSEQGESGGMPEFIDTLASAAVAAGTDGIFIETHPDPSRAKSDGSSMLPLGRIKKLLEKLISIRRVI